jgi:hypothetical protein
MAHLMLQELIDRTNPNHSCHSTRELHGAGTRIESLPHHPEYYVPRIPRLVAGLLFGAFRGGGQVTTVQAANGAYSKMVFR